MPDSYCNHPHCHQCKCIHHTCKSHLTLLEPYEIIELQMIHLARPGSSIFCTKSDRKCPWSSLSSSHFHSNLFFTPLSICFTSASRWTSIFLSYKMPFRCDKITLLQVQAAKLQNSACCLSCAVSPVSLMYTAVIIQDGQFPQIQTHTFC